MDKRIGAEGSTASRLVHAMRKHGYNKDVTIEIATVTASMPNLSIDLNGIPLESEDLIIAEHLMEHTRKVRINDGSPVEIKFEATLKTGDSVILIGDDDTQFYYVIDKAVM